MRRQEGEMSEYRHTMVIHASADEVFDFVSEVSHMPEYMPTTLQAERQGPDRVRVKGEVRGREYDSDGYLRVDPRSHRMEWGADEGYYSGNLQVNDLGDHCEVTITLSMRGTTRSGERPPDEAFEDGIERALRSIKNHCEGRGGKVESPVTSRRNRM